MLEWRLHGFYKQQEKRLMAGLDFSGKKQTYRPLSLILGVTVLAVGSPLFAKSYYVSPNGNDAAAGTLESPLRTIQKAADSAGPGDTIYLREGTFSEGVWFVRGGEEGRPIVLRNYPGEHPVIDRGWAGDGVQLWSTNRAVTPVAWVVIEGLEIRNSGAGINFYSGHNLIFRNNHVHHADQGIHGNGHHILYDGNLITHTDERCKHCSKEGQENIWNHGIYQSGTHITIVNNIFLYHGGSGVHMAAYPYNPDKDIAPEYRGGTDWVISNNLFAFNNAPGIWVWQPGAKGAVIQNNVFYDNAQNSFPYNGIAFQSAGSGHIIRNNLFYHTANKQAISHDESSGLYVASNNLFEKPLLTDPTGFDFRPTDNSPVGGKGIGDLAPNIDIEGQSRPSTGPISIGPYEVDAVTTVEPPPPQRQLQRLIKC
ncbi:MAG: right-handed parallel beta-helix repeat-containing protein [Myxococcota bacterium]